MSEKIWRGIGVSEGIRMGRAYVFRHAEAAGTDREIPESEAGPEAERFDRAVERAVQAVEGLIARSSETLGQDEIGVLKGQRTFLSDPAYCPEIRKLIREKLYSPEKAVRTVTERYAALFENMGNDYMKERAADVRDAGRRLMDILAGRGGSGLAEIDRPVVLIADDLSPSDTVQLDRKLVLAFATERGGKTSHTSIFAKSMGIPAVVGVAGITQAVADGGEVILDGGRGLCIAEPEPGTAETYGEEMERERRRNELYGSYALREARTADGRRIAVAANIGSSAEASYVADRGAEGVGLFRTEQLFLSRRAAPDEELQYSEYRKAAEAFTPREVIVRTLDIGGDKEAGYLGLEKEANPFLGYRAIRLCLDRKELFLTQLRAILRASAHGKLAVMFPMISGAAELREAKAVLGEAKAQLRAEGVPFDETMRTGMMVEIPSAALMADVLAKEVDFFSIGTNDLVQYTLAVDRGNEKISRLYDPCSPAVIRLLRQVCRAARENGIDAGMCGGMAGDPLAIPLLAGLGLDELSMAAEAVPQAKYVLSRVDAQACGELAEKAAGCATAEEVRALLEEYRGSLALE